jgi:hypothetical protein
MRNEQPRADLPELTIPALFKQSTVADDHAEPMTEVVRLSDARANQSGDLSKPAA